MDLTTTGILLNAKADHVRSVQGGGPDRGRGSARQQRGRISRPCRVGSVFPDQRNRDIDYEVAQVYEDFFGLHQRPFSLVPQADDFVGISPMQDALDSLVHCVTQSRGIAVMTSAPGLGKTMLCRRLARLLEENYRPIYLSAAGMETRLSLLQGILFELNMGYVGLSDQEARLKLFDASRRAGESRRKFLLIIDEAQGLTPRLFEEIRILTEYAPEGESLIPAVLSGSFELEEKLADPALTAFNQRIGLQLCLAPLSLHDSARFISERLKACGATDLLSIIDEEALDLICRASDGNPHCLSQLTDHACLLAFANGECPVHCNLVRTALENLKELPLRWSDVPGEESRQQRSSERAINSNSQTGSALAEQETDHFLSPVDQETDEFLIPDFLRNLDQREVPVHDTTMTVEEQTESASLPMPLLAPFSDMDQPAEFAVLEVGAGIDSSAVAELQTVPSELLMQEMPSSQMEAALSSTAPLPSLMPSSDMTEMPVLDRYTFLDRIFELPESRRTAEEMDRIHQLPTVAAGFPAAIEFPEESAEEPILMLPRDEPPRSGKTEGIPEEDLLELVQQIRSDLKEHASATQRTSPGSSGWTETIPISPAINSVAHSAVDSGAIDESFPQRRFEQLFTRLRMRRKKIEAEQSQRS